jgi:hypothetical protein
MKCRQAQDLMGAYLYGDLAPEEMRELRLHTQDCALCREDLAARGRVVSSLSDAAPKLSDEDRQRIAWSVKGAVTRRELEERPLLLRLAPGLALAAAVLVAGFALGRVTPHTARHVAGSGAPDTDQPVPEANVKVTEKAAPSQDKTQEAVNKAIGDFLDAMKSANVAPPIRSGVGSRGSQLRPHPTPPPDTGVKMTPGAVSDVQNPLAPDVTPAEPNDSPKDSGESPKKTEMGPDQNKLPKVTDPKNAETTPSESQ